MNRFVAVAMPFFATTALALPARGMPPCEDVVVIHPVFGVCLPDDHYEPACREVFVETGPGEVGVSVCIWRVLTGG